MRQNVSFAPSGLAVFPLCTHGLRRGLHSVAASRLGLGGSVSASSPLVLQAHTESRDYLCAFSRVPFPVGWVPGLVVTCLSVYYLVQIIFVFAPVESWGSQDLGGKIREAKELRAKIWRTLGLGGFRANGIADC